MEDTRLRDTLERVLFLLEEDMCGYEEEILKDIRIAINAVDRANETAKEYGYLNEDEAWEKEEQLVSNMFTYDGLRYGD